tara:strand:- start:39 stop:1202 length:1164 start_codon:yes stop_codon:yes gene_type:complete
MSFKDHISKFYPLIIITSGLLISGIMIMMKPVKKPDEIKFPDPFIQLKRVPSESVNIIIKSQGSIIPQKESKIFPEIVGPIIYVSSKLYEGSSFNKGDILAKVDPKDYELDIKSAESTLAAAKTKLSFEEAESKSARQEWERIQDGTSVATDLALRIPQLEQAESEVEAAKANLERLKRNLDKTIIRAPYDGLVRKKNIDIGTVVSPGYLIASVYATDYVEVKLPVPDQELEFLEIPLDGSEIDISKQSRVNLLGSFGGKNVVWIGNIVRMEAEIDPKSRMAVLIGRVGNPYDITKYQIPLRVGQFVEAEIIGKKYTNLYRIDRELINNNNEIVVVNMKDTTLNFIEVNILRYIDDIALINKGLTEYTPICLTNLDIMYSGMKVKIK